MIMSGRGSEGETADIITTAATPSIRHTYVYRNFTQFACLTGDLNNFCQMNNEQQYKLYNSITTRDLRLPHVCIHK